MAPSFVYAKMPRQNWHLTCIYICTHLYAHTHTHTIKHTYICTSPVRSGGGSHNKTKSQVARIVTAALYSDLIIKGTNCSHIKRPQSVSLQYLCGYVTKVAAITSHNVATPFLVDLHLDCLTCFVFLLAAFFFFPSLDFITPHSTKETIVGHTRASVTVDRIALRIMLA